MTTTKRHAVRMWLISFVLTAIVLTASIVSHPQAAQAGSNGQQVVLNTHNGEWAYLCGTSQDNTYHCWWGRTWGYSTWVGGWWWKGWVAVYSYDLNWRYQGQFWFYVPPSQPSDWYRANYP